MHVYHWSSTARHEDGKKHKGSGIFLAKEKISSSEGYRGIIEMIADKMQSDPRDVHIVSLSYLHEL